jgi:hypothetical protein
MRKVPAASNLALPAELPLPAQEDKMTKILIVEDMR